MKIRDGFTLRKALLVFSALVFISVLPNSFASDVIEAVTEAVVEIVESPAPETPADEVLVEPTSDAPAETPAETPAPVATDEPTPGPTKPAEPSESASPTPSPTPTPKPPHALENQNMSIIAPRAVNVDPRARSLFLPQIYVANSGNLLICATSNVGAFDAHVGNVAAAEKGPSSLEINGAYTPTLRVSSLGSQAAGIINSGNGLRIFSHQRALAGSFVQLTFVSLSEVSANPKLCNDGSPGNTRTIYLRGLGVDLNMIKSGVTLK
jgi:hypothetical protein